MKDEKELVFLLRIGSALGLILLALIITIVLIFTKPKAPQVEPSEPVLSVSLLEATTTNLVVSLKANGIAQPVNTVQLSAEVGGRVFEMPRTLKAGDRVQEGDLLLQLDKRDALSAVKDAQAATAQLEARLEQLKLSGETDRRLLDLQTRSATLAEADLNRLQKLFEDEESVSISTVEAAERAAIQTKAEQERLKQLVDTYPARLKEATSLLTSAQSRAERAELNLERTSITAPLDGRVVDAMVTQDSFVAPGQPLLHLADDSLLEIPVTISLEDLMRWIPFTKPPSAGSNAWFPPIPNKSVRIVSGSGAQAGQWTGRLDRVIQVDSATRTATLAVRLSAEEATKGTVPLVSGMFCTVDLPGRALADVIALPLGAVSFDNKAYLSEEGRLKTVDVQVARRSDGQVYVSDGIQPGDLVVTTRLVAPMEGVRLVVTED